jgi:hypothetical protein
VRPCTQLKGIGLVENVGRQLLTVKVNVRLAVETSLLTVTVTEVEPHCEQAAVIDSFCYVSDAVMADNVVVIEVAY